MSDTSDSIPVAQVPPDNPPSDPPVDPPSDPIVIDPTPTPPPDFPEPGTYDPPPPISDNEDDGESLDLLEDDEEFELDELDEEEPVLFFLFVYNPDRTETLVSSGRDDDSFESFNEAVDFVLFAESQPSGYKVTDSNGNVCLSSGS